MGDGRGGVVSILPPLWDPAEHQAQGPVSATADIYIYIYIKATINMHEYNSHINIYRCIYVIHLYSIYTLMHACTWVHIYTYIGISMYGPPPVPSESQARSLSPSWTWRESARRRCGAWHRSRRRHPQP